MRLAYFSLSIALAVVTPVVAQDAPPPNPLAPVSSIFGAIAHTPDGWSRNMDGSYKQAESGVLCPIQFKSFKLDTVTGPNATNPNILGVCHYDDGNGRLGNIRVRKYVEGSGSDQTTAENDKALMATDGSAPPMLMRTGLDRKIGGSRLTVTIRKNGLLVDCSVVQVDHNIPRGDFPLYCTTIPGAGS